MKAFVNFALRSNFSTSITINNYLTSAFKNPAEADPQLLNLLREVQKARRRYQTYLEPIPVPKFPLEIPTNEQEILASLIKEGKLKNYLNGSQYIQAAKLIRHKQVLPVEYRARDITSVDGQLVPRHLTFRKFKSGGRNRTGKITVRHIGGGHKQRIRLLDRWREVTEPQIVERIDYDPLRTAHIALVRNMVTDELSYILATNGLKKGQIITNGKEGNEGNMIELKNITDGTTICSIEKVPGSGAIFVRAAGTSATLLSKDLEKEIAYIKMPSGFTKEFHINCRAVIGTVSNPEWQNVDLGKAGKSRHLGIRPSVRGLAMNACDHPNGSSSGRKKNKLPKTKWGKLAKAIGKFYNIKRHFPKYANRKNK